MRGRVSRRCRAGHDGVEETGEGRVELLAGDTVVLTAASGSVGLDGIVEAHRYLEVGTQVGKIVVAVDH
ncbi:hypothetical protein [Kitasatospora sp. NBC_01539]|uniref:hypothetical protein n=1 Tax=Kitasatospora sp. NBC_01539 TaxID=2903577 RepID=UPI0038601EB1